MWQCATLFLQETTKLSVKVCFTSFHIWSHSCTTNFPAVPLPGRGRGRRGGSKFQSPQQMPGGRNVRSELKTSAQILKQRKTKNKQQFMQSGGRKKIRAKNKQMLGQMKKSGFGRNNQKKGKMRKKLWGGHGVLMWLMKDGEQWGSSAV